MNTNGLPPKQGLYDPQFEHDACGIGFVVNIKGAKSHEIVTQALTILMNLTHRGGVGSETNTGDGAGILMQIPHAYLKKSCAGLNIALPEPGDYAAGIIFLPEDPAHRSFCESTLEEIIRTEGQTFLGWRTVPTEDSSLGKTAKACKPFVRQVFIGRDPKLQDELAFERKLYIIRKRAEQAIRYMGGEGGKSFYIASLSSRTMVYKGMLTAEQVGEFYTELTDPEVTSAMALVHSRYSTNTFPSWERAHPYRYIIHNGEINTLRGNVNWMAARQAKLQSKLFGDDLEKVLPIINTDGSDSAMFDNCLEFLMLAGRSLPHAAMMMIPEPWSNHESMSDEKKAFYEFHSCLMEPWDGPAAVAFTDGSVVGAVLDRNGLRPSRYYVTKDDLVIMSSEVGVVDVAPERILEKGRLLPGRMFLVDTKAQRIITDEELKLQIASEHPYREWLNDQLLTLEELPVTQELPKSDSETLLQRQKAFGYTYEDLRLILGPMAMDGVDPIGAMGTDAPLAVLSQKPQLLYNYFKQLFAQVTNPPIDALREEIVTATETMMGSEGNVLEPGPESCRLIKLKTPILSNKELVKLRFIDQPCFRSITLPILFDPHQGGAGLEQAMGDLFKAANQAIRDGANILILSDRDIHNGQAAIPALMAVAGLHHHLIREKTRNQVSIILESGEPREVHHYALLLGYGVSAVNPYLAYESIEGMIAQGLLAEEHPQKAIARYIKACVKGVVKILSKMGISTIQSYQGAQIFEALGVHSSVIDKYFTGTPSRIGGVNINIIAEEARRRHEVGFAERAPKNDPLETGGQYQWRKDGEEHLFNPETVHKLQIACKNSDYELYKDYAKLINDQTQRTYTLRGLLDFKKGQSIPLDEVESVDSICRRFKTGAMSYGSISQEAHECLAIAMNRIGGKSNTGEGGEDPERFTPLPNGDSKCSAIKQVASGRFGVTSEYLVNAIEIQIKMAQGAKPGEGGQLPGRKVYPWVAKVRHSTPGVGLISPPPHHDIYSIEDLAELIHDLKNANPQARISVKLVSEVGVGTIAAGVAKGRADVILISGYDGGTGASPRTSIRHAGLPWELGLAETQQTLVMNDLRSRVVLETDGKLMTGRDVAVAALLGAEEYGFATAPLVILGCVMMRVCNLDTCPVGVATQNPELRKKFCGDPQFVVNYMHFVAQELREIMAEFGFRSINEMIGRSDLLMPSSAIEGHWKAQGLDFSNILYQPEGDPAIGRRSLMTQDHGLEASLDQRILLKVCEPALSRKEQVRAIIPIQNTDRVAGTILGSEVTKRYGAEGLPEETIRLHFKGSAGQSFGAFVPKGISMTLEGDANDYLGKGLSGGKIVVYPSEGSTFVPEENIIIGNVAFYGATSGEAYIRGVAGERFCVRNSGVNTVVEGVGDHGCEYMTGGRVVILGSTGRNFAAGMSGGVAYIYDEQGDFPRRCNREMVDLELLEDEEELKEVKAMIERHAEFTGSAPAKEILARWGEAVARFVKVIPKDYKRVLEAISRVREAGMSGEDAIMAAFVENKSDLKRVSGN